MCSCLLPFEINRSVIRLLSVSTWEEQPPHLGSHGHVAVSCLSSLESHSGRAGESLSVLLGCSCLLLSHAGIQGGDSGHARDSLAHKEIRQFSWTQIEWLQPQVPIKEIYGVFKKTLMLTWLVRRCMETALSKEPCVNHEINVAAAS